MVQAQQSSRAVPHFNEILGERVETGMVSVLDRFEHCKLEVLECKIHRLNEQEGLTSSISCSVIALSSNRSANANSSEVTEPDIGSTPKVKLPQSPVKRYSIAGRTWSTLRADAARISTAFNLLPFLA